MIKLVCNNCGKRWFTANTAYIPKCDACGGELTEEKDWNGNNTYKSDKELKEP